MTEYFISTSAVVGAALADAAWYVWAGLFIVGFVREMRPIAIRGLDSMDRRRYLDWIERFSRGRYE